MTKERLTTMLRLSTLAAEGRLRNFELLHELTREFEAWEPPDLRCLLEMAAEAGYAKREWEEAVEKFESSGCHPYYERQAATEKLYYAEMRAKLYEAAGIPEPAEDPAILR